MGTCIESLSKKVKIKTGFSELYTWLRENNFDLILMSSTIIECTKIISKNYPFDNYLALELCTKNERYTGNHNGAMTPTRKIQLLQPYISKYRFIFGVGNYRDIDVLKNFNCKFLIEDEYDNNNSIIKIKKLSEVKTHLIKYLFK